VPNLVVAFFSIMEPGTYVPPHRGLTKAWLNCHLGMVVPRGPGKCAIEVAGETVEWREGEWLVFDETNRHQVWNERAEPRVVLFLQVRRPMRLAGRAAADTLVRIIRRTSFVQDIKRHLSAD
jgi:beta-hydroxylase